MPFQSAVVTQYPQGVRPPSTLPQDRQEPITTPEGTERIRTGPAGIKMPAFLPYFTDVTGETAAMRLEYRKMLACPEVKAPLYAKIFGVGASKMQMQPYRKDDRNQQIADFMHWVLTRRIDGGIPMLVWNIFIGGLVDGYSVCDKDIQLQEDGEYRGKHVLRCVKPKCVDLDCVLMRDEFANVTGVMALRFNQGEVYAPNQFIIYANNPLYGSPTGMSDLRSAYGAYWFLDTVKKLRAMGAEKRAFPVAVGTYDDNSRQASLEAGMRALRSQSYIAIPKGVEVSLLDMAGSSSEYFDTQTKSLQEQIIMSISLSFLATMSAQQGVQRGSSQVHKDTADLAKWWVQEQFANLLNNLETGVIKDIVDRNYLAVDGYPFASFGGIDESELGESVKVDTALVGMGMPLSKEDRAEYYGRKLATDPSDILKPPQPPAANGHPYGAVQQTEDRVGVTTQPVNRLLMAGSGVPAAQPFRYAERFAIDPEWYDYLAEVGR